MANGIAAKYNTPILKPLPASSPIWLAVLVQMEHWATERAAMAIEMNNKDIRFIYFVKLQ